MRLRHPAFAAAAAIALGSAAQLSLRASPRAGNHRQDLRDGLRRGGSFSGDYTGRRHSPLKQLTPQNVAGLVPQWMFQTDIGLPGRGLSVPLVVATCYVTGNNNPGVRDR
jgi:glucose dehydrogenase